jgi:holo-ACP synthase/triphosphoribosyl-dephospho-CoA synthase
LNPELNKVLLAREQRAEKRNSFAKQGLASLSLSLNIPGYPKSNEITKYAFSQILNELGIFLMSNRVFVQNKTTENFIDEAGQLYLVALRENSSQLKQIKLIAEEFEKSHPLGRISDVDIFDENGKPVSSGKKKKCVICNNKAAVDCMREKTHEYSQLRSFIFKMIDVFKNKQRISLLAKKLSEFATKSLLHEISLSPKPGLVCFNNSGSHKDMNFYTFLKSISAISPFWDDFAKSGFNFNSDLSQALPVIRQIGIKTENAMFEASQNVNTQKGLVFLLGLSVFTIAYLFKKNNDFNETDFVRTLQEICKDLVEKELLNNLSNTNTHGEKTFAKFGLQGAGVRYEAQNGFPLVFKNALPYLEKELKNVSFLNREKADDVLRNTLLKIMCELNDSNVLYRKGIETANRLKVLSQMAFENKDNYNSLNDFCLKENISPGGSADMLALSLFFFFVKQELNFDQ